MKKILHEFRELYNKIDMESAGISNFAGFLLREEKMEEKTREEAMVKVGFICNAGLGSSAMGATLFRRKLQERGVDGVDVKAYPADRIPKDLAFAVCQRDFMEMTGITLKCEKVYTVENLLNQSEYAAIVEEIYDLRRNPAKPAGDLKSCTETKKGDWER